MIRRPPRSTHCISSAASDVYKRQEIAKAGVEDQITSYSFQKGNNVYLEQDADMQVFVAARTKQGLETKFSDYVNKSRPSRIRNYDPYMPTAVSVVVLNKGPVEELAIDPSKPMTIVGPKIYGV